MALPEKKLLNLAIVHLKEIGWSTYLIAKLFDEKDKRNFEKKYLKYRERYTLFPDKIDENNKT